jgi:hypothetical protein
MSRLLVTALLLLLAVPSLSQAREVVLDRVDGLEITGRLPANWEPMDPERTRHVASRLMEARILGEGYAYEEELRAWEASGDEGLPIVMAFSSRGGAVDEAEIGRITQWLDGSNLVGEDLDYRAIPFRISRITYDQARRVITSKYYFHYQRERYAVVSSVLFTGYGFCTLMYVGLTGGSNGSMENEFTALVESVAVPPQLRYPEPRWLGIPSSSCRRFIEVGLGVVLIGGAYTLIIWGRRRRK